jgi:hypothetical protein
MAALASPQQRLHFDLMVLLAPYDPSGARIVEWLAAQGD